MKIIEDIKVGYPKAIEFNLASIIAIPFVEEKVFFIVTDIIGTDSRTKRVTVKLINLKTGKAKFYDKKYLLKNLNDITSGYLLVDDYDITINKYV